MKLNGFVGKGTGKLGSSVFAVSGGEQIVRQYNPNVSNPSTDAQVEQRAKLKLMSQIAAALAIIIAFKKKGLVSARNQFVSANIGLVTFENGQAELPINGIDLTGSKAEIPSIRAVQGEGGGLNVNLTSAAAADVDGVLYASVHQTSKNQLEVIEAKIATTPGEARTFAAQLQSGGDPECVYAYGIKYTNEAARQRYADYVADIATDSATLDVESRDILSGASFTRTRYVEV